MPNGLSISLGIMVVVLCGALGLVLGLYFGERGRRLDLVWLIGERARPDDAELRAEVVPSEEGTSEARARSRAEIAAVLEGLKAEAGGKYSLEELQAEAVRLVSQMDTEVPEGMA